MATNAPELDPSSDGPTGPSGPDPSHLLSAVEGSATAMMMIDRDLEVTYANPASFRLFDQHSETFKRVFPGFDAANVLGTCIDDFHKNPAHQRRLLADPSNLPHTATITIGELVFRLNISAMHDPSGAYIGSTLEWADVTEMRAQEELNADYAGQIEAIGKAQCAAEFNLKGRVIKANENFVALFDYPAEDVVGMHHSAFVSDEYRRSPDYSEFWSRLTKGDFNSGTYERFAEGGRQVWVQGTYNPIHNHNGDITKIVMFVTDVTERIQLQEEVNAVVSEIIRVVEALSAGDLTQDMTGRFTGRFAELQSAINSFIESLGGTMAQTKAASSAVGEATVKLRNSSEQLAKGAAQQQEALQISSEALTETSAMVQSTSENAVRANELVQQTAQTADEGRDKMNTLTSAMTDISSSSGEISKIIKVIDEIAFQTNLLAVNAAVEAARAGRHGRGFAVVAQEVRSLAGRSAKAAQATAELIEQSTKTVERGVNNVEATSTALEEIRESVLKVRDIVGEISAASAEQSRGVSEVRHSIDGINASAASASQQSAGLASEANGLQSQARVLKDAVGGFTLREHGASGSVDDEVMGRMAQLLGVDADDLATFANARRRAPTADIDHDDAPEPDADMPSANTSSDVTDDDRGYGTF